MRKKWIAVVLLFVTLLNLSACGASDNYESNEKDVTEQSKDFKENEFSTEDIINRAFTKACRETDGMSVVMRVKDRFSGSYGSTKYNSDITINSPVEFKNDKTYMSENEYEFRTVATSYGNVENALDIFNAVSDSEEHSEQVHSQIYSTDDGTVWQTMETYNSDDGEWQGDWQQFHEIDTKALTIDECTWFLKTISEEENWNITQDEDGGNIIIEGVIEEGSLIGDTYYKLVALAGGEPDYCSVESVPYAITISKDDRRLQSIRFDVTQMALYAHFGTDEATDGLSMGVDSAYFYIDYNSFTTAKEFDENKAESLAKADEVVSQTENMDNWKQLYIDHLNSENRPQATYTLINMDDNSVPQLVYMLNEISDSGAEFVSLADGELNVAHIVGSYFAYYNPTEHTIYTSGGKMGGYYDSVYSYAEGRLTQIHSGKWTEDLDENEEVVYTYNWDGEDVSEEEYTTYLKSAYDTSAGVELDWEADWYTKEEIIQMIADY